MTLLTIVDVRNRVMALCARIVLPAPLGPDPIGTEHVYRDEQECSFAAACLPAFVVKAGERGGDYEYGDSDTSYDTVRELRLGLYIAHIKDESYKRDMDMVDLTEIAAASVIDFFAAKPTLAMDYDRGLVSEALIKRTTAPHTMLTKGSNPKNRGLQFRMQVRFRNRSTQDDE